MRHRFYVVILLNDGAIGPTLGILAKTNWDIYEYKKMQEAWCSEEPLMLLVEVEYLGCVDVCIIVQD